MSQEDTGAEAIISDDELEIDLTPDGTEDVVELAEKLANAEKAKKQILARARKAEQEAKTLREANSKVEPTSKVETDDEALDLRLDGYTKDEVRFILANGGRKVLEDKTNFVTIALNTRREQQRAEAAASQVVDTTGMSEVERKYTPDQLANMPLDELNKILPHADPQ